MPEPDKHILLAKWLEGSLTEGEAKSLGETEDLGALKASLDRMEKYGFPPMDEAALWEKTMRKRQPKKAKVRRLVPMWMRAAAAIFLLAGISLWWWAGRGTTVIAGMGEQREVTLPGQSEVVLNAGSELRYFEKKWQSERRMKLNGEAYFKVTKGVPFRVESAMGTVEVLGTQFDIYDRGNIFKVTCYEGRVRVVSEKAGLETILQKGEGVEVHRGGYKTFKEKNAAPSWTGGVSVFSKTPLSEVFAEMGRQYDLEFNFENIDLQRRYVGEFPHGDLNLALESVCGPMGLKYDIKQNGKIVEIRAAD